MARKEMIRLSFSAIIKAWHDGTHEDHVVCLLALVLSEVALSTICQYGVGHETVIPHNFL